METLQEPDAAELDRIRKKGLRPEVVGCFVNDKNVLFLYVDEYKIWQLPQGGIENNETVAEALNREMREELGNNFVSKCDRCIIIGRCTFLGEDHVYFPPFTKVDRTITTSDGQEVPMSGKEYFFFAIQAQSQNINVNETEFDEHVWLPYEESHKLADTIVQKGKKRITKEAIEMLRQHGLI